ncbi:MAG: energy-coupling factor ABC transporter substrate-binding protein [Gemmiger sp.]|nr:energy-coupling factor ABC transporter substrate-binding protein [Gemmiger sp.]
MGKNTKIALAALAAVVVIALAPLFALKGAEFGGSDDAGSEKIAEITGEEYQPWFTPVLEQLIGGELPGEVESLFFCLQTGLGVGVVAYGFGYLVARKKFAPQEAEAQSDSQNGQNTQNSSKKNS